MSYYHGQKVPNEFIMLVSHSPQEIEFKIRVEFKQYHLYHLILDGNIPLAEGWFPTTILGEQFYRVKLRAKEGVIFEPGKSYRLCIGSESPEKIYIHSSSYFCLVDYEFMIPAK